MARCLLACAGCDADTEVDKLQEPSSSGEMIPNNTALPGSDAAEPSIVTHSPESTCSDSISAPSAASSMLVVNTVTDEGPLVSCIAVNRSYSGSSCVSCSNSAEELTCVPCCSVNDSVYKKVTSSSDRQPVCTDQSSSMDSAGACSEHITTTDQKAEDVSVYLHSPSRGSLVDVKCSNSAEKCRRTGDSPQLSQKCSTQSSIRSFFAPLSKKQPSKTAAVHCIKSVSEATSSPVPQNQATQLSQSRQTDANSAVNSQHSNDTDKIKKCPFYKWVPGKVSYFLVLNTVCRLFLVYCARLWKSYDDPTALLYQFHCIIQFIRYTE